MSKEGEEDEKRLYQCARKYEKIVKQFDVLVEMMNARNRLPKRWRNSRGSSSSTAPPASSSQPDKDEVFVHTVSQFLQELKCNPTADPDCSTTTSDPK